MKIRSSRFFNNSASDKGGAIHAETRSHLLDVQDTEFDTNMVGQHPALRPLTVSPKILICLHHIQVLGLCAAASRASHRGIAEAWCRAAAGYWSWRRCGVHDSKVSLQQLHVHQQHC